MSSDHDSQTYQDRHSERPDDYRSPWRRPLRRSVNFYFKKLKIQKKTKKLTKWRFDAEGMRLSSSRRPKLEGSFENFVNYEYF